MKTHYDLKQKTGPNFFLCKSELLAAILSFAILLILNLWLIFAFRQTPDRIGAAHDPYFGDYVYSLKTEMIILIDVILFSVLFLATHAVLGRLKRRFCR
jgi:hypothetical protein